jgi:hypothetical protein
MSRRLKLGAKSEIENMCVAFWCLTTEKEGHEGADTLAALDGWDPSELRFALHCDVRSGT